MTQTYTFRRYRINLVHTLNKKLMNKLILDKKADIDALCAKFNVKQLDLFGSALGSSFDPKKSDLDFLVVFKDMEPGRHADAYFGLLAELEELFRLHVDLVELNAIKNPYFLEAVEESRSLLYAA